MSSDWYKDFMRMNGFDIDDPYFEEKFSVFTPQPLGKEFGTDKEVTDYFEAGGEYDKAAGDSTGLLGMGTSLVQQAFNVIPSTAAKLTGSVLDFGGNLLTAPREYGLELAAEKSGRTFDEVLADANETESGIEKFGRYTGNTISGLGQALTGIGTELGTANEALRMPVNDASLSNPTGNFADVDWDAGIGDLTNQVRGASWDTIKDAAALTAEQVAQMAGATALGAGIARMLPAAGEAVALGVESTLAQKAAKFAADQVGSNISKGYMASNFADMYAHQTKSEGDSRLAAAALSGPYAMVSGTLEGIGAAETFGARVIGKYLVGNAITSRVGRRAAAGLLGATAEGMTEMPQSELQILMEELPGTEENESSALSAWDRIKNRQSEVAQAGLAGFIVGGNLGTLRGLGHLPKSDAKALQAGNTNGLAKTDDEAIVDIANGVATPDNVAHINLATAVVDASKGITDAGQEIEDSVAAVLDSSVKAIENRNELEAQIRSEVLEQDRVENALIQQAPAEKIEKVTGDLVSTVDALVQRDLAEFDNINLGWQNFMLSAVSNKPQDLGAAPSRFDDPNALAVIAQEAGFDPQMVAQATAARFEKIGVDASVFANGLSQVDLNAVREQLKNDLTQKHASKSLPVAEAIEKAVTPEEGSNTHTSIQTLKAMAGPRISDGDAYNQAIEIAKQSPVLSAVGLQEALKISKSRASGLIKKLESEGIVGPQTRRGQPRQVLLTPEERAAPADQPLSRQTETVDTPKETIAKKLLSFINDKVRSSVSTDWREAMTKTTSLRWLTKPYRLANSGAPDVNDYTDADLDTFEAIKSVSRSVGRDQFISIVTSKIKSDTKVSKKFHSTFTDPFVARMADLREKHDVLSESVRKNAASGEAAVDLAEVKKDMATEVRKYRRQLVRQAIPPGIARSAYDVNMEQLDYYVDVYKKTREDTASDDVIETVRQGAAKGAFLHGNWYKGDKNQSVESAPAAKIVSMWLYTNANSDLSKRIVAKMVGQEYSIEEENKLANDLASDLSEDGLFESLIEEDDFTKRAFLNNIVEQGKSVSSPHGLYIALTSAGEDPAVAISMVAGLHAASVNAQRRTGVSMTTFWDRLADHIMTAKDAFESEVPQGIFNPGGADTKETNKYSGQRVGAFSKMAINVLGGVHEGVKNSYSIVMQHELMHALHRSGLLLDVIGPEGIKAIEKITGPLYYPNGKAIWDERTAERLAVAWEIFLATNNAPSPETQSAFDAAKNFFKTYLNSLYNMVERVFHAKMWNVKGPSGNPMRYRETDTSWVQYSVLEKQLNANKEAIKALYRLVYAEPTSEAHMATGGLVGVSGALVSEMSDISGIDMSGAIAKTAKLDVRPDTIELGGKLVKIDKSEEDEDAVMQKSFEQPLYNIDRKVLKSLPPVVSSYVANVNNLLLIYGELIHPFEGAEINDKEFVDAIANAIDLIDVLSKDNAYAETVRAVKPYVPFLKLWMDDSEIKSSKLSDSLSTKEKKVGPSLPLFHKGRKVDAEDLPDAAEANATRWFHGSRIPDIHENGISSVKGAVGIMGTGGYLTDSPYQGDRYRTMRARNKGTDPEVGDLYALKVNVRKVINLEKPLDWDVRKAMASALSGLLEEIESHALNGYSKEDYELWKKTNKEIDDLTKIDAHDFLNNKDWVDHLLVVSEPANQAIKYLQDKYGFSRVPIDGGDGVINIRSMIDGLYALDPKRSNQLGSEAGSRTLDDMIYIGGALENFATRIRREAIQDKSNMEFIRDNWDYKKKLFLEIEKALRKAGYDAYTHIGGVRTGNETQHRVLILLDPSNELSNEYPPSVVKYWPTRRVGVEHGPFERRPEGWTPESGKPISRQQLSDALGFQGMNPDDPLVIEALDDHERNVGTRLDVWSKPMERRSSPVMQSGIDKKKQKAAEALLKSGASLRESYTANDWLQEASDHLISDGKMSPLYNNEEIDFSSVDGVKTLLTEWPRLTRRFIDYAKSNGTMAAIKKALPYIGKAHLRSIVSQWTSAEKNFANVLAPLQAAVEDIGLPNVAMHVNNMSSLSRWAGDITERVPMYFDPEVGEQGDWVIIPGSESWRNITNDLIAWQGAYFKIHGKTLSTKTMQQFSVKSQRDLRLWMLAQREIEVFEHSQKVVKEHMDAVTEWEQKVRDGKTTEPKPAEPKIPKLSEAAISLAKNVKMVLEMTYGEDIKTLDMLSLRYSKWESDFKLVPLLKSKLITPKMYADMMSAGLRHVPFARVVEMVEQSGAVDVNIDGSMYQVLDYLKQDLTFKVQDPMLAAIKSVQSVNILTQRQIAKNSIGRAISESVPTGTANGSFVVLHSKRKITKEEFDKLPEEQREEKQDKESAKQYYQIVPATKDDIGAILAQLRHRIQGLHGKKKNEAEVLMNGGIFAAYLEPGNPIYIRILDAEVAQAFYTMNNPQVLYATNAVAKWFGRTQQWFKGQYVTSPQFVFNQLFRDIPNALIRSKHGMRLSDIANGIVTSLNMAGFDEISQYFDKSGESGNVSADALKGFGPFGGLVSSVGPGGNMDVNLLIAASHDSGSTKNSRRLIHSHIKYYENMKKHGAVFPSLRQVSDAFKAGDWSNVKDNALLLPKLLFSLPRAFMSVPASVLENAPRLAERRLMMDVDMMQYPSLMERFPGRYRVDANGKALAGYAGTLHRRAWEAAEKQLAADPNAIIPVESLPIQYASMEKDFDTRGITLPFDQKGKWTPKIDIAHIFFGPAMLDMYTSIKKIGDNSITQGVLDRIRTSDEVAKRKSKLNYNTTSVLGQEFKYTDQDGMALAMAIKAVAAITIPAIAQAAYYWDDDEWQAQSMTEKLGYYHIPTPWGKRLRIARGLGFMQLLFSDLPTAAMLAYGEKDPKALKKWASRFLQSTPIGAVVAAPMAFAEGKGVREAALQGLSEWTPEIIKGTSEALITDYDAYRDKQVSYETGFSPEDPTRVKSERFNILANTIARIEGVQPSQARHQIKSLFPGTKAMIPWLANYGMEAAAGATTGMPDDVEASNAPIYGQGTGGVIRPYSKSPFGVGNEFVQALYKLDRSLTGYYNSSEKMSETTKKIYLSQHPELQYRDIVREAVDSINADQDEVMNLRKEGLEKGDNGLTEYDYNKKMTMQAMETYRLFYGKLLGQ